MVDAVIFYSVDDFVMVVAVNRWFICYLSGSSVKWFLLHTISMVFSSIHNISSIISMFFRIPRISCMCGMIFHEFAFIPTKCNSLHFERIILCSSACWICQYVRVNSNCLNTEVTARLIHSFY